MANRLMINVRESYYDSTEGTQGTSRKSIPLTSGNLSMSRIAGLSSFENNRIRPPFEDIFDGMGQREIGGGGGRHSRGLSGVESDTGSRTLEGDFELRTFSEQRLGGF